MKIQTCFQRYEQKYILDARQYGKVMEAIRGETSPDEYGKSTVCNVYYDTPDFRLIRRSLEKPVYKEKLRLRSYGAAKDRSPVFLELKKKYRSIVYKRREIMPYESATKFLENPRGYSQITEEISYFICFYRELRPAVCLSYEREAFFGKENKNLRITFDSRILWRDYEIDLRRGAYGSPVLPPNTVLMEIKTDFALPYRLAETLSREKIFQVSFSKYGRAYLAMQNKQNKGDCRYA